jgi:hypothetical protein
LNRAALSLFLLGCTSAETVAPAARFALQQTTNADTIRLPAESGGSVEFGPNAKILVDGLAVDAKDLYWNERGIYARSGDFIASWDSLQEVRVEQTDGAATVAVTAAAGVVVVVLAVLLKGGGKGLGGSGGGGHGTPSAATPRSAPNPPLDPVVAETALRTADALVRSPFYIAGAAVPEEREGPWVPLFSRDARRRAAVRLLARAEGGACWPGGGQNGDCLVGGARAGVRLADMFELTGGVRTENQPQLGTTRPLAVFGAMLHGEVPSLHWLALAIGASVAFDADRAHVIPTFGVRFRPVRGLWLGLVPLQPVYATETGGWNMVSGIELTGEL